MIWTKILPLALQDMNEPHNRLVMHQFSGVRLPVGYTVECVFVRNASF